MKIAICVNGRPHEGGVTSFVNSITDGLRQMDHKVDIITIFGISDHREIKDQFVTKVDKFLKKSNLRTFILYKISKLVLLFLFLIAHSKNKYNLLLAIDISVVNSIKPFVKIPIFLTVHSSIIQDLLNQGKITENSFMTKYITREEYRAYQNAKGLIANSQYTATYIKFIQPKPAPITIIRNIVDQKKYYPQPEMKIVQRQEYGIPKSSWVILFVGRIVERKGVHYLIEAFKQLLELEPDSFLVLAGAGEDGSTESQKAKQLIKKYNLEKQIKFLGSIPNEQIPQIYNLADCLAVPSVTYKGLEEPLGIITLEAMATGVPVVASNIGGLKEVIQDQKNGLLVPEKDSQALAQALIKIKQDQILRQKLITNALADIQENYIPSKVVAKFITFFNQNKHGA